MTPLKRSRIAMLGGRARAASMTADERSAWARYMLAHQRRFWDGKTLPRKPLRARPAVSEAASPVSEPMSNPLPLPTPVVVISRRAPVAQVVRPGIRFDV